MKERFEGEDGHPRLLQALSMQEFCRANDAVIARLTAVGELQDFDVGDTLISQNDTDTDLFFILLGRFDVIVNGARVNQRGHGVHVGEIAGIDAGQRRSATLIATEASVVLKVSDGDIRKLLDEYPKLTEALLRVANQRLVERNELVAICNERPHVFVISSKEALDTAREVQSQFRSDEFVVRLWDQGVFTASRYPIPSLERALNEADFAVVIAQPDDVMISRKRKKQVPRDNVTFEMGMAVGKLSLDRTIILQPSDKKTNLASDTEGLGTARYRTGDPLDVALGPACNDVRKRIRELGVRRARHAVVVTN